MFYPQLVRFAGWVKRIAEEHEPADLESFGDGHAGCPAPQAPAADGNFVDCGVPLRGRSSHSLVHGIDQFGHSIRRSTTRPLLPIRKVDPFHRNVEVFLQRQKQRVVSISTGTVEQDQTLDGHQPGMTISVMSGGAGGYSMSNPSSVCTRISEMARFRYHLRFAGTTYHGASVVLVLARASSNASK